MIDRPRKFYGSPEQRTTNINGHTWWHDGGEMRCVECDVRYGGRAYEWACGAEIPREVVVSTA